MISPQHIDVSTGEVLDGPPRRHAPKYHQVERPRHSEGELYRARFNRLYGHTVDQAQYEPRHRAQTPVKRHQTRYAPRYSSDRPLIHLVGYLALYGLVVTLLYISK